MRKMAALFLGTAIFFMAGTAQAMTVSAKVGPLIKEAQSLAQAGNYKAAMGKLDEADSVKAYPDDGTVIEQLRHYVTMRMIDAQAQQPVSPSRP